MHVIAAKAVAFKEALQPDYVEYAAQIIKNAKALAARLTERGLDLVSGGTDTHLMLVDLTRIGLPGRKAERFLQRAHITVNKNTVPNETRSPFVTSGIRIGTPALTTRGMGEAEMRIVGDLIVDVLEDIDNEKTIQRVREAVMELTKQFPLYQS